MIIYFKTPSGRTDTINTNNKYFKVKEYKEHFTIRETGRNTESIFKYKIFKNELLKIEN